MGKATRFRGGMRILIIAMISVYLGGCDDPLRPRLKCQDGITYEMQNGAWVESGLFKNFKCLPVGKASVQ